ncbi:MAG: trigger factor [Proteobacteria bacterium]|nr:trigger factor [Pseudomonadota bacterium]
MQVEKKESNGLQHNFTVIVPAQDVSNKVMSCLDRLGKNVKIDGFRPGKVPANILKQRFGKQAFTETLEEVVQQTIDKVLQEHQLKGVSESDVDFKTCEEGKDLVFDLKVELLPEIVLKPFTNIELEKVSVKVKDEDVKQALQSLSELYRIFQPLTEDRPSKAEDRLTFDLTTTLDNKLLKEYKNSSIDLILGEQKFIFGEVEKALYGIKKDETQTLTFTVPQDFQDPVLIGKTITCSFTVKQIKEPKRFAVGDELAQELAAENLADLENRIQKTIEEEYEGYAYLYTKRHLLDILANDYNFLIPQKMVDKEFALIWARLQEEIKNAQKKGEVLDDMEGKTEEDLKKEYREIAQRRVRLALIISEIAKTHKIHLTQNELTASVSNEARGFPGHEKEIFDFYLKNKKALEQLIAESMENKVIQFILSQATLKEKEVDINTFRKMAQGVIPVFLEEEKEEKKEEAVSSTSEA